MFKIKEASAVGVIGAIDDDVLQFLKEVHGDNLKVKKTKKYIKLVYGKGFKKKVIKHIKKQ